MLKWIGGTITALLAACAALYFAYTYYYPYVEVRYRLTIEAEVGGQRYSGSSVQMAYFRRLPPILGSRGGAAGVRGEAVVVDLGPHGRLFGLLRARDKRGKPGGFGPATVLMKVMLPDMWARGPILEVYRRLKSLSGEATVPVDLMPYLVRFKNLNDPNSVEAVDPENLAATYGAGARLIGAAMEITHEPLTKSIDAVLPWLNEYNNKMFDGQRTNNISSPHLANDLSSGAFKSTGIKQ